MALDETRGGALSRSGSTASSCPSTQSSPTAAPGRVTRMTLSAYVKTFDPYGTHSSDSPLGGSQSSFEKAALRRSRSRFRAGHGLQTELETALRAAPVSQVAIHHAGQAFARKAVALVNSIQESTIRSRCGSARVFRAGEAIVAMADADEIYFAPRFFAEISQIAAVCDDAYTRLVLDVKKAHVLGLCTCNNGGLNRAAAAAASWCVHIVATVLRIQRSGDAALLWAFELPQWRARKAEAEAAHRRQMAEWAEYCAVQTEADARSGIAAARERGKAKRAAEAKAQADLAALKRVMVEETGLDAAMRAQMAKLRAAHARELRRKYTRQRRAMFIDDLRQMRGQPPLAAAAAADDASEGCGPQGGSGAGGASDRTSDDGLGGGRGSDGGSRRGAGSVAIGLTLALDSAACSDCSAGCSDGCCSDGCCSDGCCSDGCCSDGEGEEALLLSDALDVAESPLPGAAFSVSGSGSLSLSDVSGGESGDLLDSD